MVTPACPGWVYNIQQLRHQRGGGACGGRSQDEDEEHEEHEAEATGATATGRLRLAGRGADRCPLERAAVGGSALLVGCWAVNVGRRCRRQCRRRRRGRGGAKERTGRQTGWRGEEKGIGMWSSSRRRAGPKEEVLVVGGGGGTKGGMGRKGRDAGGWDDRCVCLSRARERVWAGARQAATACTFHCPWALKRS